MPYGVLESSILEFSVLEFSALEFKALETTKLETTKIMKVPARTFFFESLRQNTSLDASSGQLLNNAAKAILASSNDALQATAQSTQAGTTQTVHCPNCGRAAERRYSATGNQVRTQCDSCDYLMVSCTKTGRVIESYSPSFSPMAFSSRLAAS